ncbi:hypothetical protein CK203_115520 [Vitis vinifera]|uniref:Copia protein n=1 Tax=Vitis vinifera TaxID=29760 RepID=A0A438D1N1_VITVI|nr:hypothetical protein CK203_115520 [Vitis vinifera]
MGGDRNQEKNPQLKIIVESALGKDLAIKLEEQVSSEVKSFNWPSKEEVSSNNLFSKLASFNNLVGMSIEGFERKFSACLSCILHVYYDAPFALLIYPLIYLKKYILGNRSFVGRNVMTYKSKMQYVIPRSNTEVEFKATTHGICFHLWLKKLLENLRIPSKKPMKLYYEKNSTMNIAHNPVQHYKTKHVEVDRHFVKES